MGRASNRKRDRKVAEPLHLKWASTMCAGCAYRHGTEANTDVGDPFLAERRRLLLEVAEPFICHEECPPAIVAALGPQRKGCVGHFRAMSARRTEYDAIPFEQLELKRREAWRRVKELEASIEPCSRCDWNKLKGHPCANPIHVGERVYFSGRRTGMTFIGGERGGKRERVAASEGAFHKGRQHREDGPKPGDHR